jgi:hypothetical protein
MSSRQSSVFHLRRWIGSPKKSIAAMPTPPPTAKICSSGLWSAAADAAVVLMVSDAVTAAAPEIAAGAAGKHVGVSTAPDGLSVTAQLNATVPENPPVGVTVMVEMPFAPGDAMLTAVLLSVQLGAAVGDRVVTV